MATTTLPRRKKLSGRWMAVGIVMIVVAIAAALLINSNAQRGAATPRPTVPVARGNLVVTVAGSGSVAAEQSLNVAFQTAGTVTEVLVKEGDTVQAGQPLARLDDRNLQFQVTAARSSLESARARLVQAQQGNARPEDITSTQASVASAQANYDKVANGPTAEDLTASQAARVSAQAAYDAAVKSAGTAGSQLTSATATWQKAEASLKQAQANYDRVASNPMIAMMSQSLQLQQATTDYEQAKANYEALQQTSGTDAQSKIASAAAQLAQAKANLAKLAPRSEDVTAAKASLDQAKANLAKLTAPATATDLQIQQAAVTQAEVSLKQAQLSLDNATLTAPFAGIVTQVNVVPGSSASGAGAAFKLINRSVLHVDLKLSENDVAAVQLGQPVKLTIQSLGGWQTDGKVSYIAPAGDNVNGLVTYAVRVSFPDSELRVKVGMTADLSIVTAQRDNVLLVPSTALLPKGIGRVVQIPETDAQGRPAAPREAEVQVGLSDGVQTEIVSGVSEGQPIIALPSNGAPRTLGMGFGG
ncbi:MAG: efflux RND transporter periplasmic adaptor subunit [Chloroflexi bacterium]|nr:efflux RND transporter periplasmic adaptor subunit [Chloroflexota bacterium]